MGGDINPGCKFNDVISLENCSTRPQKDRGNHCTTSDAAGSMGVWLVELQWHNVWMIDLQDHARHTGSWMHNLTISSEVLPTEVYR